MQKHIGVGVAFQAFGVGYFHPAQNELAAGHQRVNVLTNANMNHGPNYEGPNGK